MATLGATNTTKNYNALDASVTEVEVVNTVTETTVYTYTVPGGTLSTNRMLRLTLVGDYLNNSGTVKTLTLRAKYDGAVFHSNPVTGINADATRRAVVLTVYLVAQNATNQQFGIVQRHGPMDADVSEDDFLDASAVLTIDSTVNKDLIITAQHSTAAATISFRKKAAFVELMEVT